MTLALKHFHKLLEKSKQIRHLKAVASLLDWDQETLLPKKALAIRSEQKEFIEGLVHQYLVCSEFEELLSECIDLEKGTFLDVTGLDDRQKGALIRWREDLIKAKKLPESFVKTWAKTTSESVSVWSDTKPLSDFKTFSPHLKKIVELSKERASYLGYIDHPYDALLDEYEPGMTVKELDPLFSRLKPFLINLTKTLSQNSSEDSFLYGNFEEKAMFDFDYELLQAMGFDKEGFCLKVSSHPFCSSLHPYDIRMTTTVKTTDLFAANIGTVLHEGGHGLYEMGLDPNFYGTPICEAVSMGVHESQSKLWECFIGQSLSFWKHFYPKLQKSFPTSFSAVSLDSFYKAINGVDPSFIRIYADEVTYCLHVILRYEIEKALLDGSLEVEDLPDCWNKKMHEYLGITPKNHQEGCMQDIHWAWGLFGYFPTYALGNLYAAQIFDTIQKQHKDYKERVEQGDLLFIKAWLHEHIHKHGRLYSPKELLIRSTGQPLQEAFFKKYLENKYPV